VRIEVLPPEDIPAKNVRFLQDTAGPDICWAPNSAAHLIGDRMVDVTDIANYLSGKYGPWTQFGTEYGMQYGRWFNIPVFATGSLMNYRVSLLRQAGFDAFPKTTDALLKLCQALQRIGHPAGFAFGHAFADANSFAYWLLWAFGGKVASEQGRPALESPQTLAALQYAQQLYPTLIPGVQSWTDTSNDAAFLAGQCALTNNSVSIYTQAKRLAPAIAADMDFAPMPIGPAGVPTALNRVDSLMIFRYEMFSQASKALITFLMEAPQYPRLITGSDGYATPSLRGFADNPVLRSDPKIAAFATAAQDARPVSWPQAANAQAAAVFANFVVVDMFAAAVSGTDAQTAMHQAQQRVEWLYRYG
jgi:multiple sugar transport system substrate-binding protein